jgi:hypothetical protein
MLRRRGNASPIWQAVQYARREDTKQTKTFGFGPSTLGLNSALIGCVALAEGTLKEAEHSFFSYPFNKL